MPIPSLKLIGAGIVLAALIGAFFYGRSVGIDSVLADQAREDQIVAKVTDAAQKAAADEIAKIEVKHTTIRQQLETQIREKPILRECRADERVLGLINQAINGTEPAGGGELSGADPSN